MNKFIHGKKYLSLCALTMSLLILSGCSSIIVSPDDSNKGLSIEERSVGDIVCTHESGYLNKPESANESVFVTKENATTDVERQMVSAFGDFSEGKAFAFLDDSTPCYIDKDGKPVIILEDGWWGFPFHEGRAVIVSEHLWKADEAVDDFGPIRAADSYYLIDENGNTVVPAGEYSFINSMKNGLCFAFRRVETYNGATNEFCFLDKGGNVEVYLDSSCDAMKYGNIKNWSDLCFNAAGYCKIEMYYRNDPLILVFDKAGALVYYSSNPIDGIIVDTDQYFTVTPDSTRSYKQVINYGSFEPAISYSKSFSEDPEFKAMVFCGDCTIGYSHGKYVAKYDNNGTLLMEKDLACRDIIDYADGYSIIELQNNFHAVVDSNLEFVFEPIQGEITDLGGGLFLTKEGKVYDTAGDTIFTWSSNWSYCASLNLLSSTGRIPYIRPFYSDGYMVVYDHNLRKPVYVNERGEIAPWCTDN